MDYEIWMRMAIERINSPDMTRKPFETKGLFPETKWNDLTVGERISFGQHFANEVKEGRVPGVVRVERAKNNHARYQVI